MEGENKETKITSVEKEKVKDPWRVEQGKRLQGGEGAQGEGKSAPGGRVAARNGGGIQV